MMEMMSWSATISPCAKGSKLFESFDMDFYNEKCAEYDALPQTEKGKYKSRDAYVVIQGGPNLTALNKAYLKLNNEIDSRLKDSSIPERLSIDLLIQQNAVLDLLSSLENENYIKDIYKEKKHRVRNGLNTADAIELMDCIRQGRSLLDAAIKADMIAKPLIDFYAACAYAYAIIVVHSPLHKSIDSLKGSHGHTYNHATGCIEFGGDLPSGTFLDLLCALQISQICDYHSNISLKYSLMPYIELVQESSIKLSLVTLLSMVPELNEYYTKVDTQNHLVHKLSIDTEIVNSSITYNFYIGNGIDRPSKEKLKAAFNVDDAAIRDNQGAYKVTVSSSIISRITPCIYHDLRGQLWYIESPIEGLVLPELCLHFLIISALCNIMRYSPHNWSNILTNKVSPQYSLLISKYLRLFEIKYPMLVSELITNYVPVIAEK